MSENERIGSGLAGRDEALGNEIVRDEGLAEWIPTGAGIIRDLAGADLMAHELGAHPFVPTNER